MPSLDFLFMGSYFDYLQWLGCSGPSLEFEMKVEKGARSIVTDLCLVESDECLSFRSFAVITVCLPFMMRAGCYCQHWTCPGLRIWFLLDYFEEERLCTSGLHFAEKTWPSFAFDCPSEYAHLSMLLLGSAHFLDWSAYPCFVVSDGRSNLDSEECGCSVELSHFSERSNAENVDSFTAASLVLGRLGYLWWLARCRPCLGDSRSVDTVLCRFCRWHYCFGYYCIRVSGNPEHSVPSHSAVSCLRRIRY